MPEDMNTEELVSGKEQAVAVVELRLEGLIEWQNDEEIQLTEKGVNYSWDLIHGLAPKDRVALTLFLFPLAQADLSGNSD